MKTQLKHLFVAVAIFLPIALSAQSLKSVSTKLIKMEDKYYLFLSDNSKPVSNKNITAIGKSDAPGMVDPKIAIAPFADNGFVINKDPGQYKKFKVFLHEENTPKSSDVQLSFFNKFTEQGGYLCPMHPDVMHDGEGKCSKCGLPLVTKRIQVYESGDVEEKKKFAMQRDN